MKVPCPAPTRSAGFTLVEIAIVLVIASLIIAAGIGISVAVVDNVRAKTTRQNMDAVKTALQSFIARYGRLPCPAVETRVPTDADFGIEDTRTTDPATSCTNTANLPGGTGIDAGKRGVVPWKTLGMTLEGASDGWFNQFTYMVTVTATTKTFDTVAGMRGWLYLHSATPVVAGLPPTGNQVNACTTTADDNTCNKAAVVILISHGRNGYGARTAAGTQVPTTDAGAGELENANNDRMAVSAEPGSTFDDLVAPFTPDDFLAQLAAQGAIKSERSLLVDRARQFFALVAANPIPTRTGSPGTYTYALPAATSTVAYTFDATKFSVGCSLGTPASVGVLPAGHPAKLVYDPWGAEFRYQAAENSIASGEDCPNPAVVVSMGADGALGTADDWVHYVPLADWMDVFGKAGW
jgi:prepilin-type N-terminal cleavage/methylation domain-containing protein